MVRSREGSFSRFNRREQEAYSRFNYLIIQKIMKRKILNNYSQSLDSESLAINNSQIALEYGAPHNQLPPLKSAQQLSEEQRRLIQGSKKDGVDHVYKENYQPAKYSRALQYRNSRSYLKKLSNGQYQQLELFANTDELRYFGLGTYLFIQFLRRITWLYFIFSLTIIITIIINWQGSGMSSYASSFSTYLIKSTMGNYSANQLTSIDGYLVTIIPAVNYLAIFIFYLIWKAHFSNAINQQEKDANDVKPSKFCLQIQGLDETQLDEKDLSKFFSTFGPVYEVSLIRRYKNKLSYFEELEQLQGELKERELEMILGGGSKQKVEKLKQKKSKIEEYIRTLQIEPKTISAFVHFQFQNSKVDCLTFFNHHYMLSGCSGHCMRNCCCCCLVEPEEKYLYKGRKLLIKNDKVPAPEDINWGTFEINPCGRLLRGLLAFFVILIFLGVSCAIIGLCSIYIASHASNCQNVTVPSTVAEAQASTSSTAVQCFCDANLVSSFSDSTINTLCQPYLSNIYISQAIQYAVIITSSLTNFLFGLIVNNLVKFVRPASKSSGMLARTAIYNTLFLIFNTILIPLLIYADIFGFQPSHYISFVTIISSGIDNFFQVSSITFYPTFNTVWYRNVSVIYVNYMIINSVIVWLIFLKNKYAASKRSLEDEEGKILQKHMNEEITEFKVDIFDEASNFYMTVIMCCMFCAGIPVLVPLCFVNLLSRYVTNRSLLQYNSSRIDGLGEEFASFSLAIFPFIVIVCPLIGEWMLVSNSDIYPNNLAMTFPYLQGNFYELDLELYLPFYLCLSIIGFCQFFFYNTFIRLIGWLCSLCYEKKEVAHSYHARPFSEQAKGMNILYSYNIKNNDQKRNVIFNLEKYLVDKESD